jgi:hypothetical protein
MGGDVFFDCELKGRNDSGGGADEPPLITRVI